MSRSLCVLTLLLLPTPALPQDVSLVSQSGRVSPDDEPRSADPFASLGRSGYDRGFQNSGARVVKTIPGGRRRLVYTLSRSSEATSVDAFVEARPTFRDRWLISELAARFDGLGEPEIIDEARRRSREDVSSTIVTRRLELTGDAESVSEAERFLDAVVQQNQQMVMAETWIIRRPASDGGDDTVRVALVDEKAYERRLARVKEEPSDALASPTVTVLGGQSASISIINQVAYIKDFKFEIVGEAIVADPEIGTVSEGLLLDLTPIIGPDGKSLSIGAGVTIANLRRPIAEMTLKVPRPDSIAAKPEVSEDRRSIELKIDGGAIPALPDDSEVTIQLPETSIVSWSSEEIRLVDGDAGFHVTGLRERDWDEDGALRTYDLEVLVRTWIQDLEELVTRLEAIGDVLGFDASAETAFVRLVVEDEAGEWIGRTVRVVRGKEVVAQGSVLAVDGRLAVVSIDEGTPQAGDILVP